jgi:protein-disulfide isomerase
MRILRGSKVRLVWLALSCGAVLSFAAAPVIDRAGLETYLRYAEGFMSNVHFTIDDPVASAYPGFYRLGVHLTTEAGAKLDRVYFMTEDGQQIVNGAIWQVGKSPFAETLRRLPTAGYSFGPADAKVQLVIFSDFECSYCREFAKTVRENIPKKYPREVRVVFEDFPLDAIHPWARAAAEASHCIGDQSTDAFWAYHDWIFANGPEIKADNLRAKIMSWATDHKLDSPKLQSCLDTHAGAAAVKLAETAAKGLQVEQTPTAYANGRPIPGALPWASLESVIELELKRPGNLNNPVISR